MSFDPQKYREEEDIKQLKSEFQVVDEEYIKLVYTVICNKNIDDARTVIHNNLTLRSVQKSTEPHVCCDSSSDSEDDSSVSDESTENQRNVVVTESIQKTLVASTSHLCECYLPTKFIKYNGVNRFDLRDDYNIITIDGYRTHMFDDSIHCIEHGDIVEFAIHCYDPTEFIKGFTLEDHSLDLGRTRITYSFLFFYDTKKKTMVDFIYFPSVSIVKAQLNHGDYKKMVTMTKDVLRQDKSLSSKIYKSVTIDDIADECKILNRDVIQFAKNVMLVNDNEIMQNFMDGENLICYFGQYADRICYYYLESIYHTEALFVLCF